MDILPGEPTTRREARGRRGRAGRNLPVAIAVGVGLVALFMVTILLSKPVFAAIVVVTVGIATWELIDALGTGRMDVPLVPTMVTALLLVPAAYLGGAQALSLTFVLGCLSILVWRSVRRRELALRDIAGGVFVLGYAPLLAGLSALMLAEPDGAQRMLTFILVTIFSDIGGYAFGVVWGRHPMAPSLSPKKSWEGFAGSVLSCAVLGVGTVLVLLDGPWWAGVVLGVAVACFATIGDLAESTLKRDLGIKDMGSILPLSLIHISEPTRPY